MSEAGKTNARKRFNAILDEISSLKFSLLTKFEEYLDPSLWGYKKRTLKIQCNKNHIFTRTADRWRNIKSCPECGGKTNKSGSWLKKIIANNWEYTSGEYENKHSVLVVRCIKCDSIIQKEYRYLRDKTHSCPRIV